MSKNINLLILSIFPAPYRVEVFSGLSRYYSVKVFFEVLHNENRNSKWFVSNSELDFSVISHHESRINYERELSRLTSYDAVLIYDYSTVAAMKLMLRCIFYKIKYIINCDGAFINKHPVKDRVKRFFISRASACFASGDYAKNYFKFFGADDSKIFVHNFSSLMNSDIMERTVSVEDKTAYRKSLGLSYRKIAISVGQFIHRKGYDVLLAAWRQIDPSIGLIIIGGGDQKDEYIRYLSKYNLHNVEIIDYKDKTEIFRYYKSADLFVLPTREDIWGLVINEAMSCGLPIITTDRCIAGLELVVDGENGYIVPVDSVDELAVKLGKLLNDDHLCSSMGEVNIVRIRSYTIENIVLSHTKVIDSVLDSV